MGGHALFIPDRDNRESSYSLRLAKHLGSRLHYNLSKISQRELDVFFRRNVVEPEHKPDVIRQTPQETPLEEKAHFVSIDGLPGRTQTAVKKITQKEEHMDEEAGPEWSDQKAKQKLLTEKFRSKMITLTICLSLLLWSLLLLFFVL